MAQPDDSVSALVRFLGIFSPATDALSGCVFLFLCASSDAPYAIGWSLHAPVLLCALRVSWLLLAFSLQGCGRRKLETCLEAAFPYTVVLPLGALCILRLVTDQPAELPRRASVEFWAALVIATACGIAESHFTLRLIHSTGARRVNDRQQLDVELLDTGSGHGASASDNSDRTSDTAGASLSQGDGEGEKTDSVKKLLSLVKAEWPLLIQAACFLLVAAISDVLIPHYIGETISEIILAAERGTLAERPYKRPVLFLLLAAVFSAVFSACRGATFIVIGSRVSVRLRTKLFNQLYRQDIGFFDTTKTGELTSRMTQDCQKVSDQVELNVNVFLRTMVSTVTTLVFMFAIAPPLTWVAFISVPAVVFISKKYGKVMRALSESTQKSLADANAVAEEGLSSMATVRSFAAETLEEERFTAVLAIFRRLVKRQASFYLLYLSSAMMLPQSVTALVLFYGGKLAMEGQIQPSALLSFVFYLQTLNNNFSTLGDFYTNMVKALGAAARVFELCERQPRVPFDEGVGATVLEGALALRDVYFTYPARPHVQILNGLSLEIPAGKVVALVGPSGNGKSTVISLLKRLYKAQRGEITLDGADLWSFSHTHLHRVMSIVSQEPILFARTIRENIVFGLENPSMVSGEALRRSDEEGVSDQYIQELARKANAHTFISKLPKGYDTEVGERGVQLSGGQKQRIAIARALAREPKILLLDEATSALDAESERQVQMAIDSMIAEGCMTVVIIAHRLSTVKNSHKICVIQSGQVVEEGTHEELLTSGGAYFKLVQCQLSTIETGSEKKASS
eukprot:TRINITY_DN38647_c0_g1_i1.p1 TRINITY_DN38647_c0_g1~~TRINITY_DN38647_c0_g1_i1.p1  ORF type:complete len:817 (-),score=139.65 TRINITY_DN38647_c0_g1_i1:252-2648(-)